MPHFLTDSIIRATALAPAPGDTLHGADTLFPRACDFSSLADTLTVARDSVQAATASDVFGPQSLAAVSQGVQGGMEMVSVTDNLVFKLLVVLIFIGYCYVIYYFREPVAALVKISKGNTYSEKLMEERSYMYSLFLRSLLVVGLLAGSVMAVRYGAFFGGGELVESLPSWAIPLLGIGVAVALLLLVSFQGVLLRVVGNLVLQRGFVDQLLYLRKLLVSFFVLWTVPLLLLLALNEGAWQNFLAYLLLGECVAGMAFWIWKTFGFFIGQNFSILHWFLYLCGVEIFPFSVFVLLALRNS